jgi:hypothetical protein
MRVTQDWVLAEGPRADMSVTILYRHRARPDEAGMARVPNGGYAAALTDQLEKRGFLIVEVVPTPPSRKVEASGDGD